MESKAWQRIKKARSERGRRMAKARWAERDRKLAMKAARGPDRSRKIAVRIIAIWEETESTETVIYADDEIPRARKKWRECRSRPQSSRPT